MLLIPSSLALGEKHRPPAPSERSLSGGRLSSGALNKSHYAPLNYCNPTLTEYYNNNNKLQHEDIIWVGWYKQK